MPERFIADGENCSIWEDYDGWTVYHKDGEKGPLFFADALTSEEVIERVKKMDEWPPDTRKESEDGVKLAIEKQKRIQ
jgi:hypothetical protein